MGENAEEVEELPENRTRKWREHREGAACARDRRGKRALRIDFFFDRIKNRRSLFWHGRNQVQAMAATPIADDASILWGIGDAILRGMF